jgi:hypothetical protein
MAAQFAVGKDEANGVDAGVTILAVPTAVNVKEEKFHVTPAPDGPGDEGLLPSNNVAVAAELGETVFEYWNVGCAEQNRTPNKENKVNVFFIDMGLNFSQN